MRIMVGLVQHVGLFCQYIWIVSLGNKRLVSWILVIFLCDHKELIINWLSGFYNLYICRRLSSIQATTLQEDELENVVVEETFRLKTFPYEPNGSPGEPPDSKPSSSTKRWFIKFEQSINIFLTVWIKFLLFLYNGLVNLLILFCSSHFRTQQSRS